MYSQLPSGTNCKEPACQCKRCKRHGFDSWIVKIPWKRAWQSTSVFLPGESHGQRNLADYSPWGCKESDMTEHARICNWITLLYTRNTVNQLYFFKKIKQKTKTKLLILPKQGLPTQITSRNSSHLLSAYDMPYAMPNVYMGLILFQEVGAIPIS